MAEDLDRPPWERLPDVFSEPDTCDEGHYKAADCPNSEVTNTRQSPCGTAETRTHECECGKKTWRRHDHPTMGDF